MLLCELPQMFIQNCVQMSEENAQNRWSLGTWYCVLYFGPEENILTLKVTQVLIYELGRESTYMCMYATSDLVFYYMDIFKGDRPGYIKHGTINFYQLTFLFSVFVCGKTKSI